MTVHHGKLRHRTPDWVDPGARFHVRMSLESGQRPLVDPAVGPLLLRSAAFYHRRNRWHAWVFLLMPDHLHAVLSFPSLIAMGRVVGEWKKYQERELGVVWQKGFFDHRLRTDEEFVRKCHYIRQNPVRAGLCGESTSWPWVVEPWTEDLKVAPALRAGAQGDGRRHG